LLAVTPGAAHRFLEQQAPTLLSLSEPADPPPPGGLRSTLLALAPSEASRSRFSGIAAVVRDRWRDAIWYHPLAGTRLMPDNESRRFGARRQGERPDECGKGHCGVDLGHRSGLPVYAVREGVVVQVVRTIHPKAGRYVRIRHDGGFVTSYLHLQSIRADLRPGSVVRGGEAIATSGRTGIVNAQPHLHFMLAVEYGNKRWHIDPEPLLRTARLPQRGGTQPGPTASVASQLTAQVSELPEDDIDALTDAPEPPRRSRRR
jgi:murein DD-endopeptidase MepM/ murein hydrolase activator NlpD